VDHPKPWLKYVEADDIDDKTLELEDMSVQSNLSEQIGSVDGLIVDSRSGRPYYLVVDAGGWFKTKHILVPMGQLTISADRECFIVPMSKDQIKNFPGFDVDQFDQMTSDNIKQINDQILQISEPGITAMPGDTYESSWSRKSYQTPEWWPGYSSTVAPASTAASTVASAVTRERTSERREVPDESPHFDGRAQPGDVLGVETGGETTSIGDTKEDENKRRENTIR
jgi:hypothetical protein